MYDCFISYNKEDKKWAEWIAWVLEDAGKSVIIQSWDFRPGANFVLEMQRGTHQSEQTIVVLSEAYINAEYTHPEWAAAFARDPRGVNRTLVPIRVEECYPVGLLAQIIYIDIVGLSEKKAKDLILEAFLDRNKPDMPPAFPGQKTQNGEDL